jgi:hypothetical protein
MLMRLSAALLLSATMLSAADRVAITGAVTNDSGKPLENATVMVYHARVKRGYSTFCPSCLRRLR